VVALPFGEIAVGSENGNTALVALNNPGGKSFGVSASERDSPKVFAPFLTDKSDTSHPFLADF
jgi:hypothetical protein